MASDRRAALIAENGRRLLVIEVSARGFVADCLKAARGIAARDIDRIIVLKRIPMDKRHGSKVDYPALRSLLWGRNLQARKFLLNVVPLSYHRVRGWLNNARSMIAHRGRC